ncbi:MAG: amino acid ABC transporter substrate-binding protein [Campylobacteraceae bacterium]|nr:amino acid ABC transporter substrate-binding protein [Campylobacteraceae bacterium]
MFRVTLCFLLLVLNLNAQHLNVWMRIGYQPFIMPKGINLIGYEIDLLDELSKRLNFTYTVRDFFLNDIVEIANRDTVDMIVSSINITENLREFVDISQPYFKNATTVFIKRKDDDRIKNINSLDGLRVGALKNRYQLEIIQNIPNIDIKEITAKKGINSIIELKSGEVDVVVIDRTLADIYLKEDRLLSEYSKSVINTLEAFGLNSEIEVFYEDSFESEGYGIVFGKGKNSKLREAIDSEIIKMHQDGTIKKIMEKYNL